MTRAWRGGVPVAQFGFKVQKSERLLIREAWEKADAYRPGKANWFTQKKEDLVDLHSELLPEIQAQPANPGAQQNNATSLLGALLKSLTAGDLALTLCSKEAPVLTELRDWLVKELPMEEAVLGIPEEQGRVLAALARSIDARRILDLGTFCGYSSIAMALATSDTTQVICAEPQANYAREAVNWWKKAGVSSKMEMHVTTAETLMDRLIQEGGSGSFDMAFVDIGDRTKYESSHELAMKLVHVGGLIVYYDTLWSADEVLEHGPHPSMRNFNVQLARDPRLLVSLVPLSYGLTICFKTLDLDGSALQSAQQVGSQTLDNDKLRELLYARRAEVESELASLPTAPTK